MSTLLPEAPLLPRIKAGVRCAQVEESVLVFDPSSGRYVTLQGSAASTWKILTTQETLTSQSSGFREYIRIFVALELVNGDRKPNSDPLNLTAFSEDIVVHSNFDHLILQDSFIDLPLIGALGEVNLPPSNQRLLLEKRSVTSHNI